MWAKTVLNDLLSLFFPNLCVLCKNPLVAGEEQVCLGCLCDLPYIHSFLTGNPMEALFMGRLAFSSASAFLYFEKGNYTQQLIHSLKYYNNKKLGFILGQLAATRMQRSDSYVMPDVLIPVPLHPGKQRKRGYNQSEWIAKGMSSVWGIPINTAILRRQKKTETQTRRTIYDRKLNMESTFLLTDGCSGLEGKHVLLIDDVVTSGATMEACANELLKQEGVKISLFALSATKL